MYKLIAQKRDNLGKSVKALRRAGFLPAVVYGEKITAVPISVSLADFMKLYGQVGESTIFKLELGGVASQSKALEVLVYGMQYDPLKGTPVHADFYAISQDRPIRKKIPLEFIGESPAVKNEGGVLVKVMHEIEIEALPKDLPTEVQIELSSLEILDSKIFVKDISLPSGVKIFADKNDILVLVEPPRSEEEIKALGETPSVVIEEVKTELETKKEEEAKKTDTELKEKVEK